MHISLNLKNKCAKPAADLDFENAARLRDEVKRLRETELVIAEDPMARQRKIVSKSG